MDSRLGLPITHRNGRHGLDFGLAAAVLISEQPPRLRLGGTTYSLSSAICLLAGGAEVLTFWTAIP